MGGLRGDYSQISMEINVILTLKYHQTVHPNARILRAFSKLFWCPSLGGFQLLLQGFFVQSLSGDWN